MTTHANIYFVRSEGRFGYRLDVDGEFDHSDMLDAETEDAARQEIRELWPDATIERVTDIEGV